MIRGIVVLLLFAAAFALPVYAVPPVLDSLYPAGARQGATVKITASGKFEAWPVKVWTDSPTIKMEAGEKPGMLTATVAADAPPGPHLIRVYTADGASALRGFVVGEQAETAEVEPNDERERAQPVKELPVTINGQLDKAGDVDSFAVTLKSGQTLVASVQGRRLGSAIDPMLHLVDEEGTQVAFAHDGLGLDPLLVYRAAKTGTYVVRLSAFAFPPAADVRFTGGKDTSYRLSLTTGPFVRAAAPSGVTRGTTATVRPLGWNVEPDRRLTVDATGARPTQDHLLVGVPGGETHLRVELSDGPELLEPATPPATTQPIAPPFAISGTIAAPGEEDRYTLVAKKGERWILTVRAAANNSPLDPVLRIDDSTGKQIAFDDDGNGRAADDPRIDLTAKADGVYRATVADRYHAGGPEFFYRFEMKRPFAEVIGTVDNDAYPLAPGKSVPIKVAVARRFDHATPLVVAAAGLPPGVTATSAEVLPKAGGDVTLTLTAAADAKPYSGPIRILLLSTDPDRAETVQATIDLRKDVDKVGGQGFIDRSPDVWLTLSPTASGPAPKEK